MKKFIFVVALFLVPNFVSAQQSVVAEAKKELGLTSNLNSMQLHMLLRSVATKIKGGLLPKTSGNNCNGFSCDIICTANGDAFDVLSDSEGAANPTWNFIGKVSNCELVKVEEPKPDDPKPEEPKDDSVQKLLLEILIRLEAIERNQRGQTETLEVALKDLKAEIAKGIKVRF
jgi:hypothetical protein